MKKFLPVFFLFLFSVIFIFPSAAQRTYTIKKTLPKALVISPVEGHFSNYQALVLSVPEDCNVFYSFTGSDPLISGFAYDSPVIIERNGDITLRIATVSKNNESTEEMIKYSVDLAPSQEKFYTESLTNPLLLLNSSNPLDIPENMLYSVGDYDEPFITGRKLEPAKNNGLSRIMSLCIKDEDKLYRIMVNLTEEAEVKAKASKPGRPEEREIVPFVYTCKDWTEFSFETAENTIVAIDGLEQKKASFEISLDRSQAHIFAWTDTETKASGSLVLPPKPEIIKLSESPSISGAIDLFISDPRFTFTSASAFDDAPFYTKCHIDTIYGDDLAGTLDYKVYYDGIYQGNLSVTLALDKKPPKKPLFVSDGTNQKYERKAVKLSLQSDGQIYYRISSPVNSDYGFNDNYERDFTLLKADENPEPFEKYLNVPLALKGSREGAAYYFVEAYAQDYAGNKSEIASYATVIDPFNFYVKAKEITSEDSFQDGSPSHPFSDLNQVLDIVNELGTFVRIHLDGVFVNCKSLKVQTECEIIATDGSSIEFMEGEKITVDKAKLNIKNLVIESSSLKSDEELSPKNAELTQMLQKNLISVNRGSLSLDKCEIVGLLGINGSLINLQNSILEIKDCGLTSKATNYSAAISAVNVDAKISGSRFTSIAETAVALSMNRGSLDLQNTTINVFSQLGRACELTRLDYKINSNVFNTVSKNPVWADKRGSRISFENNKFNVIELTLPQDSYESPADLQPVKTESKAKTESVIYPQVQLPEKTEKEVLLPAEDAEAENEKETPEERTEESESQIDDAVDSVEEVAAVETEEVTEVQEEEPETEEREIPEEEPEDEVTEILEEEPETEETEVTEEELEAEVTEEEPEAEVTEESAVESESAESIEESAVESETAENTEESAFVAESSSDTENLSEAEKPQAESQEDNDMNDEPDFLFTDDELSDLLKDFLFDIDAK